MSAHTVSLRPRARIMMKSGLTVAMGGNIETERMNPSNSALYRTLSFARPKEHNDPIIRERIVVDAATKRLFMMYIVMKFYQDLVRNIFRIPLILRNGWPLKTDI